MKEKECEFWGEIICMFFCSLLRLHSNDTQWIFKNSYIHRKVEKGRGDDSNNILECEKQMGMWQMGLKIKKANLRTNQYILSVLKKLKKMGNVIYYGRGNKGLRDREGAKI